MTNDQYKLREKVFALFDDYCSNCRDSVEFYNLVNMLIDDIVEIEQKKRIKAVTACDDFIFDLGDMVLYKKWLEIKVKRSIY